MPTRSLICLFIKPFKTVSVRGNRTPCRFPCTASSSSRFFKFVELEKSSRLRYISYAFFVNRRLRLCALKWPDRRLTGRMRSGERKRRTELDNNGGNQQQKLLCSCMWCEMLSCGDTADFVPSKLHIISTLFCFFRADIFFLTLRRSDHNYTRCVTFLLYIINIYATIGVRNWKWSMPVKQFETHKTVSALARVVFLSSWHGARFVCRFGCFTRYGDECEVVNYLAAANDAQLFALTVRTPLECVLVFIETKICDN